MFVLCISDVNMASQANDSPDHIAVPSVAGIGADNAGAGQQQRPEASIPDSSAQRQRLSINELQRTLAQPPPISYRPAAPAATFQVRASELRKFATLSSASSYLIRLLAAA